MQLPSPDLATPMHLLSDQLHALGPITALLRFLNLLDVCAFKPFWTEIDGWRANGANQVNFAEVSDFDANIRRCQPATITRARRLTRRRARCPCALEAECSRFNWPPLPS